MSVAASGHRYMSNGEIAMWMSEQTGRLYDKMGDEMDAAETRQEISEQLTSLKSKLIDLKGINDSPEKCAKMAAAIREFQEAHQSTPGYEDLCAKLEPMANKLDQFVKYKAAQATTLNAKTEIPQTANAPTPKGEIPQTANAPTPKGETPQTTTTQSKQEWAPKKDQIESWTTDIQGSIDSLNKDDQMGLIRIQDVNSRLSQATQLASNLIATANQAASAVVNNIKG